MIKKGDTLIEVTLAIGIFSLVAIAIASVMSGGTASSQLALETTLAREEIDTQADALRFIHSAYTANKDNKNHPYTALWRAITENAYTIKSSTSTEELNKILQYNPQTCSELYQSGSPLLGHAFVINPRELNQVSDNIGKTTGYRSSSGKELALVKYNSSTFKEASTYPRLIFGNEDSSNLADNTFPSSLSRVEGIYIIPVRDPNSTNVIDVVDEEAGPRPAYFDFYIRTCWYGSKTDQPSTISTVVRLHDPDAVFTGGFFDVAFSNFDRSYSTNDRIQDKNNVRKAKLLVPKKYGWEFKGWVDTNTGARYQGNTVLTNDNPNSHVTFNLKADWYHTDYQLKFDLKGGFASSISNITCYQDGAAGSCKIPDEAPTQTGYKFKGWCAGNLINETCTTTPLQPGHVFDNDTLPTTFPSDRIMNLKAIWSEFNETYRITLTWGTTPSDLDSHIEGQKSDGSSFHAYYGSKIGSNINGLTLAELDRDVTSGSGPETFILNTLGGKTYYYYVHCYSCSYGGGSGVVNASVKLEVRQPGSSTYSHVKTYSSNSASGSGIYWNVFALKPSGLQDRQTRGAAKDASY